MNKIVCLRSVTAMRTAYYRTNTILDDQVGRDFMHAAARDISPSRSSTRHMQFPLPAYYIISEPFLDAAEKSRRCRLLPSFLFRSHNRGMRRIKRDELHTFISVSLKTASKVDVRKYKSKLPHESDEGAGALAERICNLIDNSGTMVIAADMVDASPHGKNPGKFGVTEPDPCA